MLLLDQAAIAYGRGQGFTGFVACYFWWPIHVVHIVLFKFILLVVLGRVAVPRRPPISDDAPP